jgi:hypothetical protein
MTMMDPAPCAQPSPEALRRLVDRGASTTAAQPLLSLRALSLRVERIHFPGTKPVQLHLRALAASGQSQTLIAEWVGDAAADLAVTETARLAKPRRGQLASGATVVADAENGLVLRRPGFDAKLPGLRLLHDAAFAQDRLAALGCDPAASVTLVAHRLGKRAVLRISGQDGTRYARLRPVTSTSGQVALDQHRALWSAMQGTTELVIPRPLTFEPDLGLALFDAVPGTPPLFQGFDGFRATQGVLSAIAALQRFAVDAPAHDRAGEIVILTSWAQRVADVFPDLAAQLRAPIDRLRHDMAELPPIAPLPCHRDLHEGQILLHQGKTAVLDFDTLCLGDPALDVGNLQAHMILAALRDGLSRQAFVTALDNGSRHLSLRRIAVWRRAALLRLALIYAFTAEPRAVIQGLIEAADDA